MAGKGKSYVVAAWTDMGGMRFTGRTLDGVNRRQETEAAERALAVVWCRGESADDVKKAQAFLSANHADALRSAVYVIDSVDPLGDARVKVILEDAHRA